MKSQQRLWARATARWKANIRQSARRRRKRNTTSVKDIDTCSLVDTPAHSTSVSLRTSASRSSFSHSITTTTSFGRRDSYDPSSSAQQETPSSPSRPPAYLSESSNTTAMAQEASLSAAVASPSRPLYNKAGFLVGCARNDAPSAEEDALPPADPFSAGHIATDDKAALARMASLASAPPLGGVSTLGRGESSTLFPTVPSLEDDFELIPPELQITDCDDYAGTYSGLSGGRAAHSPSPSLLAASGTETPSYSREPSPHPILPAPPSRGRLAAPTFYEYPVSFEEDILSAEPEAGPSAPPFAQDDALAASAPPMELDYEPLNMVALPSAPPMEDLDGVLLPAGPDADHWDAGSRLSGRPAMSSQRSARALAVPDSRASPPRYIP